MDAHLQSLIDASSKVLAELDGVTPVHQAYYRVCAQYFKVRSCSGHSYGRSREILLLTMLMRFDFWDALISALCQVRSTLVLLFHAKLMSSCFNLTCLLTAAAEQADWAFDLCIAALVGEGVYNFGELVRCRLLLSHCSSPTPSSPASMATSESGLRSCWARATLVCVLLCV